jgi:zinc-ribbon domain
MNEWPLRASCPNCGADVPAGTRFCAECGTKLGADEATAREEVPPEETGPVPVNVTRAQPRLFGVTPAMLLFALAACALTIAVVLLVLAHWIWGLGLLGVSFLLFAAFMEVARRKPDTEMARRLAKAPDSFRARAGFAAHSLAARSSARRAVIRLRAEQLRLTDRRRELLRRLGETTYAQNRKAAKETTTELRDLDAKIEATEAEIAAVLEGTQRQIEDARLEVQPTEIVAPRDNPQQN